MLKIDLPHQEHPDVLIHARGKWSNKTGSVIGLCESNKGYIAYPKDKTNPVNCVPCTALLVAARLREKR